MLSFSLSNLTTRKLHTNRATTIQTNENHVTIPHITTFNYFRLNLLGGKNFPSKVKNTDNIMIL